ncbi:hypothetical protein ABBQ38_004613 [Trebouxia sp. C0009 RCD-2024]
MSGEFVQAKLEPDLDPALTKAWAEQKSLPVHSHDLPVIEELSVTSDDAQPEPEGVRQVLKLRGYFEQSVIVLVQSLNELVARFTPKHHTFSAAIPAGGFLARVQQTRQPRRFVLH